MVQNFDEKYIPLMIHEIESSIAYHTDFMFLQALAYHLSKKEIVPITIECLSSVSDTMQETALSVIQQLNIKEAIPRIEEMIDKPDFEYLLSYTKSILDSLHNNSNI